MGDLSAEPSMEDILASIKRVIKEGESQTPPRRAAPRPLPAQERPLAPQERGLTTDEPGEQVLELREPLRAPALTPEAPVAAPIAQASEEDAGFVADPVAAPPPAAASPAAPVVSSRTVEATRDALNALNRLMVKPEPESDGTLEGLVREMLRPMLSEWLDRNLPSLVEQMVAREIAKITRQG